MSDDLRLQIVEFLPRLRRFSHALTGDRDKGDDLVQETCARALSRAEQWKPGTRLDSWMFRIAQNLWLDQRRAHKVRGNTVDIDEAYDLPGDDGRAVNVFTFNCSDLTQLKNVMRALSKVQGVVAVERA